MKKLTFFIIALAMACMVGGTAYGDLNDGLFTHFEFEGNISDSSSRSLNGVLYGELTYEPGVVGNYAARFDGNTAIVFPTEYIWPLCSGTISFFVQIDPSLSENAYIMESQTNYRTSINYFYNDGAPTIGYSSQVPVEFDQWTMYTYVYENGCSPSGSRKTYKNGVLYDIASPDYSNNAYIGDWYHPDLSYSSIGVGMTNEINFPDTNKFMGLIDEIRIYNRALTDAEVQELYNISVVDFYILSGTLPNTYTYPARGYVYARETSNANLGNDVYTSDGTYDMALFPGDYEVYAQLYMPYSQGYADVDTPRQNVIISNDNEILNINPPPYNIYHLAGKVVDTNGAGIANVEIRASENTGICQSYTTTGADGAFEILLAEGIYSLHFRPPANSGFLEESRYDIPVYGNEPLEDVVLTSSSHKIYGELTHADGSSARGIVTAWETSGLSYHSTQYIDGTYQITLPQSSNYWVWAEAYIFYPPDYNYSNFTRVNTPYQTVAVSGDTLFNIVVPTHFYWHLHGKVTDIDRVIQPDVYLNAFDKNYTFFGRARTNAQGEYSLFLPSGTYRLLIDPPSATYPPFAIQEIVISGDRERDIRLSLEYTLLEEAIAMLPPEVDLALDVFDIMDIADELNYDILVQGTKDLLQIIVNFGGSEIKVTIYKPDGSVYGEYQSTQPPIIIEIPNPTEGVWRCEITPVDIPHDNYPFALAVGISPNQAPVADANGPYTGDVGSPITFDAGGSYDPDGTIVSYEWDWNNDGVFDESATSPTITHTWNEVFDGTIALRVTDNDALTDTGSASVTVESEIEAITVDIDIKPGSDPNCIKVTKKGRTPIAILSSASLDASTIDVSTIKINDDVPGDEVSPVKSSLKKDVNGDSLPDLVCHFSTRALNSAGLLVDGNTLYITGTLDDGTAIVGSDIIHLAGGPNCF